MSTQYDYDLQVWVKDGIVQRCGHTDSQPGIGGYCCNAKRFAGRKLDEVKDWWTWQAFENKEEFLKAMRAILDNPIV